MEHSQIRRALSFLAVLALCLTLPPVPAEAAGRTPDRVIPVKESSSFYCSSGNGNSYTWWMDPGGYELFSISDSGSRCTLTAKKPGRTQLWVQYSVSLYGPGQDQYGNWITVPYPDGYEKIGWLVEAAGEPCTVTFVPGGGLAAVRQDAFVGGTVSAPAGIVRPGLVLDGWFTDAACTRPYDLSTPLTGDRTLYAGWLPARTVTFVSLGRRTSEQVADGEALSRRVPDAPRGYAFEGWFADAAHTRPYDLSRPVTADLTLYADWRLLDEVTVAYDCQDGAAPGRVTYYAGETPVPPADPRREDRVFLGWYTDQRCTRPWTPGPLSGDLTIYADWDWAPKELPVSFDSQGGTAVRAQTVLEGKAAERPEDPEREGYAFDGWFTGPECWSYQLWDFQDPVTAGLTLYAGWTRNEYTVEFVNSVPTGEFTSEDTLWRTVTVAHGDPVAEPSRPSSLYLFGGWKDGSRLWDFRWPVTEDLQLKTEWMPFSLRDEGGSIRGNSDMTWELDTEGVLTLSGTGDTGYYDMVDYRPPWYNDLRDYIRTIVVDPGADRIGESTFRGCAWAMRASLPEGLEAIGSRAFESCFALAEIDIPSTVRSIGSGAFGSCESLQSVSVPAGVTELGSGAFDGCYSLRSVSLREGLGSIGDHAFLSCGALEELDLPGSLSAIGSHAFSGTGLRSVRVPGGVRDLGGYAFQQCERLETAVLEEGVETVGRFAFDRCGRLRTIVLPESLRQIGEWAFDIGSVREGPVHIFYAGSREQWEALDIHPNNDLDKAVLHYGCPESGTPEIVSFNSRGGSPVEAQARLRGERLEEPQAPERAGHVFGGWYEDLACTRPWDFARDRVDGAVTLYALWSPVPHTVRFSGGSSQTVDHGQPAREPAAPVRAGARFNGWYLDEAASSPYLFCTPVTEDLTLYPGWLEERTDPAGPGGPFAVTGWTAGTVTLAGPADRLSAVRQVLAARYDSRTGRMTDAAAGTLTGVSAEFSKRLGAGWRLFFLDASGRPLGQSEIPA